MAWIAGADHEEIAYIVHCFRSDLKYQVYSEEQTRMQAAKMDARWNEWKAGAQLSSGLVSWAEESPGDDWRRTDKCWRHVSQLKALYAAGPDGAELPAGTDLTAANVAERHGLAYDPNVFVRRRAEELREAPSQSVALMSNDDIKKLGGPGLLAGLTGVPGMTGIERLRVNIRARQTPDTAHLGVGGSRVKSADILHALVHLGKEPRDPAGGAADSAVGGSAEGGGAAEGEGGGGVMSAEEDEEQMGGGQEEEEPEEPEDLELEDEALELADEEEEQLATVAAAECTVGGRAGKRIRRPPSKLRD